MIVFGLGKNLLFKSVLGHCGISCQYPLINYPGEDPNEELKQTLEDVVCKAQPRTNTLLGFLQNLGFNPDAFS